MQTGEMQELETGKPAGDGRLRREKASWRMRLLHRVFQALAGLEFRLRGCSDVDGLAGARVPPGRRRTFAHSEGAEPDETNTVDGLQCAGDHVEDGVDGLGGIRIGRANG